MKRIIALILSALTVSAVILSGCGGNSSGSSSSKAQSSAANSSAASSQSSGSGSEATQNGGSSSESSISGGVTVNEDAKPIVTDEQKEEFGKAINSFDSLSMEPVALLGEQVTAGTNYAYLCLDKTNSGTPVTSWDIAVTYSDFYGKAKLTSIIEVHPENVKTVESEGEELDGAWKTVEITEGVALDDDLKTALDSVMTDDYTPIAVLSAQVVSGTNYVLLVQKKDGDTPVNYAVELTVDSEGKAELTKEGIFDLNYYLSITS